MLWAMPANDADQRDPSISEAYRVRFRRVLAYIDVHLSDDLSLERLSQVAFFSKYHFHRQFSALFGISTHDYVKLARLRYATQELGLYSWRSVLEVAQSSGYESPEAFARVFKKQLGLSPSKFQDRPDWDVWDALYRPVAEIRSEHMTRTYRLEDVAIIQFEGVSVAALEHRGAPNLVRESVRRFVDWRREVGLPPRLSATFNVFWDNPETTPPAEYRIDLCAATERQLPVNSAGVVKKSIPAGRCARLRHIGPDPLDDSIRYLYQDWLPGSGETPRDFPLFAQRVAFPPEVPEHESIVDVFLPLA
jgi:AraC family transcriptional regulator